MDMQPNSSNSDREKPDTFAGDTTPSDDSSTDATDQGQESYNLGNHNLVIQPPESAENEITASAPEISSESEAHADIAQSEPEESSTDAPESLAGVNTTESEPWSAPVTPADVAPMSAVAGDISSTDAKIAEADHTTTSPGSANVFPAGTLSPTPQKKSWWNKKHAIVVAVIAVVIVALGGGSAAAYSLWYQAPSKVLSDATLNFISAKSMTYTGSLSSASNGMSFDLSMNGSSSDQLASLNLDTKISGGSTKLDVPVSLVGNAQTFYFKLSNISTLTSQFVDPFVMGMGATSADQAQIDGLAKQIDGTWYSVAPNDLGQSSTDKQTGQCVQNVISDIRTNKSTQNELLKLYQAHPLFTVSKNLGSQNGSLGYEIKPVSDSDAKAFAEALKTTSVYKALVKCDSSYASAFDISNLTSTSTADTPAIDVWVSRWSHQLTKVTMNDNSDGSNVKFNFEPQVGASASVEVPKNAKSIKDLQKQIESLTESLGTGNTTGFTTGVGGTTNVTPQNQAQIEAQLKAEAQQKQAEAKALQAMS